MNYNGIDIGIVANKVRQILLANGYAETVSPIIRKNDSAVNKRFKVCNSVSDEGFLRDCMELPLRKAVTPTTPKVFEIGPCFRQGESDKTHKQEFYMMELYSLNQKLTDMVTLMKSIVEGIMGFSVEYECVSLKDLIYLEFGFDIASASTEDVISAITSSYPELISSKDYEVLNRYIEKKEQEVFRKKSKLYFLRDYPVCTIDSAARVSGTNCIERFEVYFNGLEIAHAFVDCLDADDIEQRARLAGTLDDETKELILLTRQNCLSPTVGLGIGIDRLCMIRVSLS